MDSIASAIHGPNTGQDPQVLRPDQQQNLNRFLCVDAEQ